MWLVSLIRKAFPRRFLVAKATHLPVVGTFLDNWLFGGDDILYLPMDRVIPVHQSIERSEEVVLPSQVVTHFVEEAETRWLMNACLCREGQGCEDYPVDLGCLFLGDAAKGINPQLGRLVSKEEALDHVVRSQEAGLVHMIGRNKLDTVWMGVGPGRQLLTICHCCPCCCLWRVLPHLTPQISAKVMRMPGVRVSVNGRCVGCGTCAGGTCFVDAIRVVNGRAVISDACRGCGRCAGTCPEGAIDVVVEDEAFVDQAIARISPLVDL